MLLLCFEHINRVVFQMHVDSLQSINLTAVEHQEINCIRHEGHSNKQDRQMLCVDFFFYSRLDGKLQ